MKKTVLMACGTILMTGLFLTSAAGEELQKGNPSKVVGYYHFNDSDLLLLANGTGYAVDSSSDDLLDGPHDFSVLFTGDDFIIETDESYTLFVKQKEKGRSESGGTYYAVYQDFEGLEEDGFDEGKQVRLGGYVFDNDYEVVEKTSLISFFGEDIAGGFGKVEGDGFPTPEEALGAYIEGLKDNDVDQMMAAFAVESFAENYNIVKTIERLRAYVPSVFYVPAVSDFSMRINTEQRRAEISRAIRNNYLVLTESKAILGDKAGYSIPVKEYETEADVNDPAQAMVDDLFVSDDSSILGSIDFREEFIDPRKLSDEYNQDTVRESMKRQLEANGGEDMVSVAAVFYCEEEPIFLCADAIQYEGRWYLYNLGGVIGSILGLDSNTFGMFPVKYDSEGILESALQ